MWLQYVAEFDHDVGFLVIREAVPQRLQIHVPVHRAVVKVDYDERELLFGEPRKRQNMRVPSVLRELIN